MVPPWRACVKHHEQRLSGAAPESNRPSRGLHDRTGFEDQLGHRAHAAPRTSLAGGRARGGAGAAAPPRGCQQGFSALIASIEGKSWSRWAVVTLRGTNEVICDFCASRAAQGLPPLFAVLEISKSPFVQCVSSDPRTHRPACLVSCGGGAHPRCAGSARPRHSARAAAARCGVRCRERRENRRA